jgi:hypothetical protein
MLSRERGENKVSSGLLKKTHLQTFEGEFVERSLQYQPKWKEVTPWVLDIPPILG